jgi:hypothetical protein
MGLRIQELEFGIGILTWASNSVPHIASAENPKPRTQTPELETLNPEA